MGKVQRPEISTANLQCRLSQHLPPLYATVLETAVTGLKLNFSKIKLSVNRVIEEAPMYSVISNTECIHVIFCLNFTFPLACLMG